MPQLNPAFFEPQLVWLAITFVVLYLLMANLGLPRVRATIEKRRGTIAGDLDEAAKLRTEIDIVVKAYERALAEARTQAAATVNETRERLTRIAAERQAEAAAAITARTRAAEAEIDRVKAGALGDIRGIAIDAAAAAATRLLGEAPSGARVATAVDGVINAAGSAV